MRFGLRNKLLLLNITAKHLQMFKTEKKCQIKLTIIRRVGYNVTFYLHHGDSRRLFFSRLCDLATVFVTVC